MSGDLALDTGLLLLGLLGLLLYAAELVIWMADRHRQRRRRPPTDYFDAIKRGKR